VKYLNEAMAKFDIATVVPINFVLFTISAILAGAIFYQVWTDFSFFFCSFVDYSLGQYCVES